MKYFSAVLVFAVLATALAEVDHEKVKSSIKRLKDTHDTCNKDPATKVDPAEVRKMQQEHGPPPANLGPHNLCVSKALGWQNADDGSINEKDVRSKIKNIIGERPDLEETIRKCVEPKTKPEDTATQLVTCFWKNLPRPVEQSQV